MGRKTEELEATMNIPQASRAQFCCNVMEYLVIQEIQRQLHYWPPQLAQYANEVEVMTYAMNRLPPLYASSEEGRQYQLSRATQEFNQQITDVVRQGLATVLGDPLRSAVPLQPPEEIASEAALHKLRKLLKNEQLSWSNLPDAIEKILDKAAKGKINWKLKYRLPSSNHS